MKLSKFMPLIIFFILSVALAVGLTLNPSNIPSALIDQKIPEFSLPAIGSAEVGFTSDDLKGENEVILVNFFASWCVPCHVEHPYLMMLKERGYKIYGVDYKDKARDALGFLDKLGNPYFKTAADQVGRVSIDWGVGGFPETFIIQNGIIKYKHAGPIQVQDFESIILPVIESLGG
ncbi:MAG: DsbE family thiol:disulfide interchange protein [Proteobacteria bacterium]|jgi:cytochrome c biogenesis protein CcmG, thiol:disulfide interchange protein DsbE|nr:DsbE family thiol:disulfide interchange protein [Pseudomonadota bacterium]